MKKYILIIIAILEVFHANAQESFIAEFRKLEYKPFILERKNHLPVLTQYIISGENDVDSVKQLKPDEVKNKYGIDFVTKHGAIIYYLKPGLKYLNISDIYSMYNVSEKGKTLPLYIDRSKITIPKSVICVKGNIHNVEIIDYTSIDNGIERTEKILHITSNFGYKIFKERSESPFKLKPVINNISD